MGKIAIIGDIRQQFIVFRLKTFHTGQSAES